MTKVIILAGGLGTRLAEETGSKPKPMVEIGGRPMLWHIMQIYSTHGFNDFLLACGYKSEVIKQYFANYSLQFNDLEVDLKTGGVKTLNSKVPDWRVTMVDTGMNSMTGGRIKRMEKWIGGETFMATYGDGVANVNIRGLLEFHQGHGKLATVTAVRPPARFGGLAIEDGQVKKFMEKPQVGEGWINGGFFVFEPQVMDYIEGDDTILERAPLETLAEDGQLQAYLHDDFWQPMDTLREKDLLEDLWKKGEAPWKIWG
ncbi:MAG: glucose-1-phosphate cytidylyltransferase [Deltaproteobacteria bacterium]|nr:glucose-1-phosphate cytidylyltransferase [Deltaproteobacteria bacterium]